MISHATAPDWYINYYRIFWDVFWGTVWLISTAKLLFQLLKTFLMHRSDRKLKAINKHIRERHEK